MSHVLDTLDNFFLSRAWRIGGGLLTLVGGIGTFFQVLPAFNLSLAIVGFVMLITFVVARAIPYRPIIPAQTTHQRQQQKMTCRTCRGTGRAWGLYNPACHKCGGKGYIFTDRVGRPDCPRCRGTGWSNGLTTRDCSTCQGVGLLPYDE